MQQIEAANTVQGIAREKMMAEMLAERDGQLIATAQERGAYEQQAQALQQALQQATAERDEARKEVEELKRRLFVPPIETQEAPASDE